MSKMCWIIDNTKYYRCVFFFFKQKTAYEIYQCDWSSDVCSSDLKLYIVPFGEIQKEIVTNIHPKYRMIIYRRYMLKIINKIAEQENIKLIITGDSVGQVASQTVSNLHSIYEASRLPVLSPLITYNKDDTVNVAKIIGTYEISILPYPDSCSYMIAVHPETRSKLENILNEEIIIKPKEEQLISSALEQKQIFEY